MILGAVIAGGRSTRFGSDKALALIGGERLIDRTIAALDPQVDRLVVCGRKWPSCAQERQLRSSRRIRLARVQRGAPVD